MLDGSHKFIGRLLDSQVVEHPDPYSRETVEELCDELFKS